LFVASLATAQNSPIRGYAGGYGPYVPLITTPEISLQSRPTGSAVGATNATGGLQAGARNSTFEIVDGNVSAEYTQPVWYSGGTTPEISHPSVRLPHAPAMDHPMMAHMEHMMGHEAASKEWTYFGESVTTSATEASSAAKTGKHASRTYTNADIDQVNQKTGAVKYDGKTETIK
jgi:hypothetical protein